jgi:hypothetical protein
MGANSRRYAQHQLHYLRKEVAYNTTGIDTDATVEVGRLPANAVVTSTVVNVTQAFNAATTNVLIVGTAADNDALVDASTSGSSVTEGTVGVYSCAPATLGGRMSSSAETTIYAKYSQSGTAASAGVAVINVFYTLPDL